MKKRLYFTIFLLMYLLIAVISILNIIFFQRDILENNTDILKSNLEYLGNALLPSVTPLFMQSRDEELKALVDEVRERTGARVTVIDPLGTVRTDTQRIAEYMDSHEGRPEVVQALQGEKGSSLRYSDSVGANMLYVAMPIMDGKRVIGVLRVSMLQKSIEALSRGTRLKIFLFSSAIILLSAIGALLFLSRLLKPIGELSEVARRGAQGDFDARIFLKKEDILKETADNYNQMLDRFKTLLKEYSIQKEELSTIISSMQPGLIVLNKSNEIVLCNRSAERIIHDEEVLGSKYWKVLKEPGLFSLIEQVQNEKRPLSKDIELNNGIFQVSAAFVSSLEETVLVFHDITNIKNLERMKKDFVMNVSHELRTPLTAIKGYADTIEETDRENLKYLEIIKRHTDRLIYIVEDLLTLSELEEKGLNGEEEFVQLESVVDQVLRMFEGRLKERNISLVRDIQKRLPSIRGDFMKLEQVLINLVDNAIKYTEKGEITVSLYRKEDSLVLTVKDTGIGISSEHLPRIFERFYTVDKSHSRKMGGTGLGLSIVKHIVQLHRGIIDVESMAGSGSTFTLRFPIS